MSDMPTCCQLSPHSNVSLVLVFHHIKAAQRKTDFKRLVAHKGEAKQSSSVVEGGNIISVKLL